MDKEALRSASITLTRALAFIEKLYPDWARYRASAHLTFRDCPYIDHNGLYLPMTTGRLINWDSTAMGFRTNLRYFVAQYVAKLVPSEFPLGTLIINISASFILGFFLVWTSERVLADPRWRLFVAVGFCATYSTYSSYAFETFVLFERGQMAMAAVNIMASNVVCFIAVVLGSMLARSL